MEKTSPLPDFWPWVGPSSSSTDIFVNPSPTERHRFQIELSRVHKFAGSMLIVWPCSTLSRAVHLNDLANLFLWVNQPGE